MNKEQCDQATNSVKGDVEVFEKAIDWFGGQASMATAIGLSQPHISLIKKGKRTISLDLAVAIQTATQDKILASQLRPDKKDDLARAK